MIKFEGTTFKEKETISALLDTLSRSQATYYAHQLISYRIQIPDTTPSSSFGRQWSSSHVWSFVTIPKPLQSS